MKDFVFATTNAELGNAKEESVQRNVLAGYGFNFDQLVLCEQVHRARVVRASGNSPKIFPETDGLLTDRAGLVLGVFTADCAPLFVFDPAKKVCGILHVGWRGAAGEIVLEAVQQLKEIWGSNPKNLKAHLGPHIRQCCYEVGAEFEKIFSASELQVKGDQRFLSLEKAILTQLNEQGVGEVSCDSSCTCCSHDFYSYRRDKTKQRMLSFISIK